MEKSFNILIGGKAGEGIKVAGLILAKTLTRLGFSTFSYQEYPSLIRGGHNTFEIHFSAKKVYSQVRKIDILVALDKETLKLHKNNLSSKTLIIYDKKLKITFLDKFILGTKIPLSISDIAIKHGNLLMLNIAALGAVLGICGFNLQELNNILEEIFKDKDNKIILANQKCALDGFEEVKNNFSNKILNISLPHKKEKQMVISGNEAVALGAISSGMKFFSAYPMTPATSILHYLAEKANNDDLVVKHAEDEISVINLAVGASYAGVRAMVATSGGGFCLMTEGLGLAGMTETPLVVVNSSRPGPSSGMPTWSAQGDLLFMINASQDEFARIVLAPGDTQECFFLTQKAFDLAEKYQTPVLILLDKNLSESYYSHALFPLMKTNKRYSFIKPNKNYLRYKNTSSGISPRPILGTEKGISFYNSYEHDEAGLVTEESRGRTKMQEKRQRKFKEIKKEIIKPYFYGQNKAKTGIISWGSNKGPILEALKHKDFAFFHLNWLWPFPKKEVQEFIKQYSSVYCVEGNATGQLAQLIRQETGLEVKSLLKFDGRPWYPEEIVKKFNGNGNEASIG